MIGVDYFRSQTVPIGSSYAVPLAEFSNRALLYCQPCRPDRTIVGSFCTVTAGHIHCSECHGGKPQDTTSEALCEHVTYIMSDVADQGSQEICFFRCFELINAEKKDDDDGSTSRLSFQGGRWKFNSLSSELERDNMERFPIQTWHVIVKTSVFAAVCWALRRPPPTLELLMHIQASGLFIQSWSPFLLLW